MTARTTRHGFTLIELLVVIAIIAVIATLAAGTFFRVRAGSQEKATSDTISKLNITLKQQWTASLDWAKKNPMPDIVRQHAAGDPDRANALWAYLSLRANFPQSIAEAQTGVTLLDAAGTSYVVIPAKQGYIRNLPTVAQTATLGLSLDDQAAMCLYVALTANVQGGMVTGIDDSMTASWPQDAATQFKVFRDTFNRPITYRRFFSSSEVNQRPFIDPSKPATQRDPLDPTGKLPALLSAASHLTANQKSQLILTLGRTFDGSNFIPTIYSSGLNRRFDPPNNTGSIDPVGDDLMSYRLSVEGRSGN